VRRWLRPGGLALFVGVTALLVLGWVLLADTLVKRAVEGIGTRLVGARVELGSADVGLFPPALTLTALAVTDPDAPMTNAVEVGRAALAVDGGALLGARLVVDAMRVEGVRFGTPRARSGALSPGAKKTAAPSAGPGLSLPSFDLPDVGDILRDHPLTTVADAEALARDVRAARAAWKERIAALPDQKTLEAYRERVKALKESGGGGLGGLLGAAGEARDLKRDIDRDVAALQSARDDLKADLAGYRRRAKAVADGPAAEARRLADLYAGEGLAGVGAAFLTEAAERWVRTGLAWYHRVQPLVERAAQPHGDARAARPLRAKGVDVRFPETNPRPDFLVREAAVDVALAGGTVSGTVRDLTPDPEVLGRPLTFAFAGARTADRGAVNVNGTIDRVRPDDPRDTFRLRLAGAPVHDLALSRGGAAPVTLAQARADLAVDGARAGDALDVTLKADLSGAHFAVPEAQGQAARALGSALAGVRTAKVEADVTGTVNAPKVRVRSDLDRIVADAVRGLAAERVKALEADLTAAIRDRAEARLADARGDIDALDGDGGVLGERRAELEAVLKDALQGATRKLPF
jgi:uncharacterized protein (TIGR03545 family)